MEAALVVARLAHFAATAALFGGALFPFYAQAPRRNWLRFAAVLSLVSGLAWLATTAATMSGAWGGAVQADVLAAVAGGTPFGRVWIARLAVLAFLAVIPRWERRVQLAMAGLALGSIGLTGHALLGEGPLGAVHPLADILHLLAAGAWLGGLAALAGFSRTAGDEPLVRALRGFSGMGTVAVAILVGSGLVNAAVILSNPRDLIATSYGGLLTAKLVLFAAMLAFAALNRFVLTPRIARHADGTVTALKRSVLAEQVLGGLVILAVAVLGTLDPAA